jgi:peptide deformylase
MACVNTDLAYIGHPILRKKAVRIECIDPSIFHLAEQLKATVTARHGLGLAAPQVGAPLTMFVACFPDCTPTGEIEPGHPIVFINPRLSDPSDELWVEEEGCLSLPKIYAPVQRPVSITVTYQDEHGEPHTERFSHWPAKIIMHENDHLNGVLFIDRVNEKTRKNLSADLTQLKKHYQTHNDHLKLWKGRVE